MRIAYIGLSSPTAYFYDHDNKYFYDKWAWNPILESPQGLITLFDELWFLTRALCPCNLRGSKFVKFLDEDSYYFKVILPYLNEFRGVEYEKKYPFLNDLIDFSSDFVTHQFKSYNKIIQEVFGTGPSRGLPIDNHSHGIDIGKLNFTGNSANKENLALDILISIELRLAGKNVELITNRFNSGVFKSEDTIIRQLNLAQNVTIKRIPVVQRPEGPMLGNIEKIRENKFLVDFREKVVAESINNIDIPLITSQIEKEFNNYRNDLLISFQGGSKIGNSIAKNLLSATIGLFVPAVGEIKSLMEDTQTRKMNWTGFISQLERE